MTLRGESVPPAAPILTKADRNETVRRANANVTLPMQLPFKPPFPECTNVATGNAFTTTAGRTQTTVVERTTIC